jgi:FkbM family methyltransferase
VVFDGSQTQVLPDCNIAIISGDSGPCSWVYQLKRLDYDRGMLDPVIPLIRKDMAVLDIGAFIGSHTVEYLKHAACVVAFEPNPAAFACLSHNCPDAVRINVALGDRARTRYWTRIYPNCGASYLSDEETPGCLSVPVRVLDALQLPPRIGFIKLDAEGEEVAILRGARETIANHRPTMLIEVNKAALNRTGTSETELLWVLREYGYETRPIWPETEHGPQWDVIATPKNAVV